MISYHDDQIANPPWPDLPTLAWSVIRRSLTRLTGSRGAKEVRERCRGRCWEVGGGAGRRSGVMLLGRALGRRGLASSARLDPVQEALLAEKVLLLLLLLLL